MNFTFVETGPLNQKKAKNIVAMFHGVGSNAKDLISIVPYIQETLNQTHFISIDGGQKYSIANFGFQWFELQNRDQSVLQREIAKTIPKIIKFLEIKVAELDLEFDDLFLMGFSQGSMLATHIATSVDKKMAGIIGIAGAVIPKEKFQGNNSTPICLIHGMDDEVIRLEAMNQGENYLNSLGFMVEAHTIPFLAHSIDIKCLEILVNFIKKNHEY